MCSRQQQMGRLWRAAHPSCRTCAGDWGRAAGSAQLCRALTSPVYPHGINLLTSDTTPPHCSVSSKRPCFRALIGEHRDGAIAEYGESSWSHSRTLLPVVS